MVHCDKCKKSYSDKRTLQKHYNRKHDSSTSQKFDCKYCDKSFSTKVESRAHLFQVHKQKFKCENCSKLFTYKLRFEFHGKICKLVEVGNYKMKIDKREVSDTSAKLKVDSIDIDGKAIQIKQLLA